jgi:hypothetical protein
VTPRRPDQAEVPQSQGLGGGFRASVVRARLVIVSGPNDGVFIYKSGTTPALGNPPITWESSTLVDPFGNVLPSTTGVAGTGTFSAGNTVITTAGDFVYNGTPATGNLIASLAPAAGADDGHSNTFKQGVTAYVTFSGERVAVNLNTTLTAVGVGMQIGAVVSPPFEPAGIFGMADGIGQAHATLISGQVTGADASAFVETVSGTESGVPGGLVKISGTLSSPLVIVNPAGTLPESWHAMTLINGWANVAGFTTARYQLRPTNEVEIIGAINAAAANAVTFFTLPAGYQPANQQPVCSMGENALLGAGLSPWIRCDAGGNLTVQNTAAIPGAWESFFHGFISLDA